MTEGKSKQDYWSEHSITHGSYLFHRDELLRLYECGKITTEEFLRRFEKEAAPYIEDEKTLVEILLAGLQPCYKHGSNFS